LPDKTSNYIVTTQGNHVNSTSLKIRRYEVRTDSSSYPISGLSAIKKGRVFYSVQDGQLYNCVYFGKLMLLNGYAYTMQEVNMQTHGSSSYAVYHYFLQRQGQSNIVELTNKNLIEHVQDNPLALQKARASRIYSDIAITSVFTTIAGLGCVFLPQSSHIRKPAIIIGLFSIPTSWISSRISKHKKYKAVVEYDR
jgi:hypothetical protein